LYKVGKESRLIDVLVLGSGPAALSLAHACGKRGLSTCVLGGRDAPWAPNYGVWVDDAQRVGIGSYLASTWDDADIVIDDQTVMPSGRRYGRVARRRLRSSWLDGIAGFGGSVVWAQAVSVAHHADRSVVQDDLGGAHCARIVVDATGHRSVFVQRHGEATSFQAAVGLLVSVKEHPWALDRAVLMDWRRATPDIEVDPSFLYVMPHSPTRLFVEETSLVRGPALPFPLLKERLFARLARMGVAVDAVEATELCHIPMDTPVPDLRQRVLGFGAAASFVHPGTGYQLVRALQTAPRIADIFAEGLHSGAPPGRIVRDGWQAMWSPSTLAARELLLYGSRLLQRLDTRDTISFFQAFHRISLSQRTGYLSADPSLWTLASAMLSTFFQCPSRLRRQLLRGGSSLPSRLLQAGFPSDFRADAARAGETEAG